MISKIALQMAESGFFGQVINNPAAQFGTDSQPFLGATLLPEIPLPSSENKWTETAMRVRPLLAVDSGRHTPIAPRASQAYSNAEFSCGYSDIGAEMTSHDMEMLSRIIDLTGGETLTPEIAKAMMGWLNDAIVTPLQSKVELQRWQAIVNAQVVRVGDNGFTESIPYENPSGHRFAATVTWSNNSNDPMVDILAAVTKLNNAGFEVARCITSNVVTNILLGNEKMRDRVGSIKIASGSVMGSLARLSREGLRGIFEDNEIPSITEYNKLYYTATGRARYLASDVMVLVGRTPRDYSIKLTTGEPEIIVPSTLGYSALGTPAHLTEPGRYFGYEETKRVPITFAAEAKQATVPVILEPEAIVVITGIS